MNVVNDCVFVAKNNPKIVPAIAVVADNKLKKSAFFFERPE